MDRVERQLQKVERLHQKYSQSLEDVNQALALVKNAEAVLRKATQKASLNRDDYNFALAEYRVLLKKQNDAQTR